MNGISGLSKWDSRQPSRSIPIRARSSRDKWRISAISSTRKRGLLAFDAKANPTVRLKLDMFAAIELPTHFSRRALVAPSAAIQQINGTDVVFIRKSRTQFETRPVKIGKTLEDLTEIQSGLGGGEEIVKSGSFHLKSIALSGQIGEER